MVLPTCRELPWGNVGTWQLINLLMNGGRLEIPPRERLPGEDTPSFAGLDDYISLLQRCWVQEPADRPTFHQIVPELRELLERTVPQPLSS